jgi:hypothetical protein
LSCLGPDLGYDLSLARTGCAFRRLPPGVNVPGLQLRIPDLRFPGPFGPLAPLPRPVCPDLGRFFASSPFPVLRLSLSAYPNAYTPLRDFYLPRDHRSAFVQPISPPTEFARFPLAPRCRRLLDYRLRITVPGSLRFRPQPNSPPVDVSRVAYPNRRNARTRACDSTGCYITE